MRLNPLSRALEEAQKKTLHTPPPPVVKPKPQPPQLVTSPTFPPLHKVEGGLIERKPINRQAAIVTSKAPWWAMPPQIKEKTVTRTTQELEAHIGRLTEHIRKCEQVHEKLKAKLELLKSEASVEKRKFKAETESLVRENADLKKQIETLNRKLMNLSIWEKI